MDNVNVAPLQILSKVIASNDYSIISDNFLTKEHFIQFEDEYNYISNHVQKYGNVPDKTTFLSKFPDFELVEVTESNKYLLDCIKEEHLYYECVPVLQKSADLLKTDANEAVRFLLQEIGNLQMSYSLGGTDLVADSDTRYEDYIKRKEHPDAWTFTTGFPELDALIHGIERQEELIVIFARINNGKSFVTQKICVHVWQLGFNVGYLSPEMSANSVGYRFDTLYKGFSNKSLLWADKNIDTKDYQEYIQDLKQKKNKFIVSTPADFDRRITVTKLKEWIKQYKLDLIVVDGISYLTDERGKRGDNKTTSITNISEDLMSLSVELKLPIIVVSQANRQGVTEDGTDDTPELENIKDSDGLAANASKVLSLKHTKDGVLKIGIKKQRFGPVGGYLSYQWNPDIGEFTFIPSTDDIEPEERTEKRVRKVKKQVQDKEDVF